MTEFGEREEVLLLCPPTLVMAREGMMASHATPTLLILFCLSRDHFNQQQELWAIDSNQLLEGVQGMKITEAQVDVISPRLKGVSEWDQLLMESDIVRDLLWLDRIERLQHILCCIDDPIDAHQLSRTRMVIVTVTVTVTLLTMLMILEVTVIGRGSEMRGILAWSLGLVALPLQEIWSLVLSPELLIVLVVSQMRHIS
jgi:hypothetical protein